MPMNDEERGSRPRKGPSLRVASQKISCGVARLDHRPGYGAALCALHLNFWNSNARAVGRPRGSWEGGSG
ncbi:MAG: hypothetical protein R3200_17370, partial [Xanthomonadales bacterium]|nr:hypothetical protein [Xanthomonadales bacterium]